MSHLIKKHKDILAQKMGYSFMGMPPRSFICFPKVWQYRGKKNVKHDTIPGIFYHKARTRASGLVFGAAL